MAQCERRREKKKREAPFSTSIPTRLKQSEDNLHSKFVDSTSIPSRLITSEDDTEPKTVKTNICEAGVPSTANTGCLESKVETESESKKLSETSVRGEEHCQVKIEKNNIGVSVPTTKIRGSEVTESEVDINNINSERLPQSAEDAETEVEINNISRISAERLTESGINAQSKGEISSTGTTVPSTLLESDEYTESKVENNSNDLVSISKSVSYRELNEQLQALALGENKCSNIAKSTHDQRRLSEADANRVVFVNNNLQAICDTNQSMPVVEAALRRNSHHASGVINTNEINATESVEPSLENARAAVQKFLKKIAPSVAKSTPVPAPLELPSPCELQPSAPPSPSPFILESRPLPFNIEAPLPINIEPSHTIFNIPQQTEPSAPPVFVDENVYLHSEPSPPPPPPSPCQPNQPQLQPPYCRQPLPIASPKVERPIVRKANHTFVLKTPTGTSIYNRPLPSVPPQKTPKIIKEITHARVVQNAANTFMKYRSGSGLNSQSLTPVQNLSAPVTQLQQPPINYQLSSANQNLNLLQQPCIRKERTPPVSPQPQQKIFKNSIHGTTITKPQSPEKYSRNIAQAEKQEGNVYILNPSNAHTSATSPFLISAAEAKIVQAASSFSISAAEACNIVETRKVKDKFYIPVEHHQKSTSPSSGKKSPRLLSPTSPSCEQKSPNLLSPTSPSIGLKLVTNPKPASPCIDKKQEKKKVPRSPFLGDKHKKKADDGEKRMPKSPRLGVKVDKPKKKTFALFF